MSLPTASLFFLCQTRGKENSPGFFTPLGRSLGIFLPLLYLQRLILLLNLLAFQNKKPVACSGHCTLRRLSLAKSRGIVQPLEACQFATRKGKAGGGFMLGTIPTSLVQQTSGCSTQSLYWANCISPISPQSHILPLVVPQVTQVPFSPRATKWGSKQGCEWLNDCLTGKTSDKWL